VFWKHDKFCGIQSKAATTPSLHLALTILLKFPPVFCVDAQTQAMFPNTHCTTPVIAITRSPALFHAYPFLHICTSLLLWQWSESQVWLDDPEVREQLLGQFIVDRRVNNHVLTRHPVNGSSDPVLVASLQ